LSSESNKELSIRDFAVIYKRRRRIVYGTAAAVTLLAAVYCAVTTRQYEATGTIEIQTKSQDRLGLESIRAGAAEADTDSLEANMDIQTQASILQSETLALKTIKDLRLENTNDFKTRVGLIGRVRKLFFANSADEPAINSLESSPQARLRELSVFSSNLKVKPVPGTRLIQITYLNPDPKLAADVINKLAQSLIDYSFQTRFNATNQAAGWLSDQLGDLRRQSEELQHQVAGLESQSGVYSLGTIDPRGRDQAYSGVLDRLEQATAALSQAEQSRILRGAILHAADNGDAELLSGLAGNTMNGATVNNNLAVIQTLRGQEATQQAALQQAQAKFGPAYPKLQEVRSNIAGLERSIQEETERLKSRAHSDYENATRDEEETRNRYNSIKAEADTLNNKSVDFAILRQEADESRKLYQELLERFKEAGVLESLKGSTITVVDPGRIPGSAKTPNVRLYMASAIIGGLLFGFSLALVAEALDTKIRSISEVERISGNSLVGATPFLLLKSFGSIDEGPRRLESLNDPQSMFIEASRAIRTQIFLNDASAPYKVILVTSSVPGEGKTTVSANLAVVLAKADKKVLLLDTDLRLGDIHTVFNLPAGVGLSELLSGKSTEPALLSVNGVANLDILRSGSPAANASELLGSRHFTRWLSEWRDQYDHIVLDSAPLLPVTDSLALARLSDLTLLIARPGLTEKTQLARSSQLLKTATTRFVGAVVNGLPQEADEYSSYFGYGRSVHE
jgi:polysaccharide biosynthesis transport protein